MNSYTSTHSFEQQLLREKNIRQMLANNANADLERKLVYQATADFRESVTPEHSLYAVTIVPYLEHLIRYRLTRSRSSSLSVMNLNNLASENESPTSNVAAIKQQINIFSRCCSEGVLRSQLNSVNLNRSTD